MIYWILAGGVFALWLLATSVSIWGAWKAKRLTDQPADGPEPLPRLSIIVPALNEEASIEPAMCSLLALDYLELEIIAVDDRSTDATGTILDRLAAADSRLRVVQVHELPTGWLGKNHALHLGSEAATGDWILFTDADVYFAPDTLRRAVRYAARNRLDHLTAYPEIILGGFWETLFVFFFGVIFQLKYQPWNCANPRSRAYMGIGAFNLVRADRYRTMGGHASLPMDIADDMKLGKRMKESGGRQECLHGYGAVRVRWIIGLRGAILGLEKNAFAGADFRPEIVLFGSLAILIAYVWPTVGLFVGPLGARLLCVATLLLLMLLIWTVSPPPKVSPLYALAFPLGAVLFVYIFIRSMVLAYRRGGIQWRGTLYPLDDLRRGIV